MAGETFQVDLTEFVRGVQATRALTGRSIEEEAETQLRGVMKEVMKITPPAGGSKSDNAAGRQAEIRARGKMEADLRGRASQGYRGSRRAGIFTVLPDDMIDFAEAEGTQEEYTRLWVTKDGRVYGAQRSYFRPNASHGEMRAHHKKYFRNGVMSRAGTFERSIGRWKWIDQMVVRESAFQRYLKREWRKIGHYAAGFLPGLRELKVPASRYVTRNAGSRGSFEKSATPDRVRLVVTNRVGWSRLDRTVQKRVNWAVAVQVRKMERRMPYLLRAAAKRAMGR